MKLSYLIDTDWVIHYLNGNEKIIDKLTSLKNKGLAISVISLAELYEGVYYSTDPLGDEQALRDFLLYITYNFYLFRTRIYADLRRKLFPQRIKCRTFNFRFSAKIN